MTSRVIDVHTHAFNDQLAVSVIPQLEKASGWSAHFNGTLAGLRRSMALAGVTHSVLQPVATKPAQVRPINEWLVGVRAPDLLTFGALHPDLNAEQLAAEIAYLKDHQFLGVKLHAEYQQFFPDEDRLVPIYSALERAGLVVLMHAGVDLGFTGPVRATPQRLAQIPVAYPDLKLILAHLGGFRLWDEVKRYLVGLPVWLDTAFCVGEYPGPKLVELSRMHGVDHILFASDAPWGDQAAHRQYLRQAGFMPEELRKIEGQNAEALFSLA